MESEGRIFIYLRLRSGEQELARTKIREFAGLGTLLADFRRVLHENPPSELPPDELPALDYVDANDGAVLISFQVDLEAGTQVIEGRIPSEYQARMLDPESASVSTERFVERAAPEMSDEEREEFADQLASSGSSVLDHIRRAIDDEGRFVVRLPLG